MKAVVVGAGIGGLTAAIALRRNGIETKVYEQAPSLGEVGAGLTLWANALLALRNLGLDRQVIEAGAVLERGHVRRADGSPLSNASVGEAARRLGTAHVCIHRADLQALLLQAAGDEPRLGHECVGIDQHGGGVVARFANGAEVEGDLLIGADGLNSLVRRVLHGEQPARYAGYIAWRGGAQIDLQTESASSETWGRGKRFGVLPIGGQRGFYWFGTSNAPPGSSDSPAGRKADALAAFRGWHPPIEAIIEATDASAILRNDIADRAPLRVWGHGRITLLGDAAHPMTPNMGQGACQAIEDAVVLAHCLKEESSAASALRSYETARMARTARIMTLSRRIGGAGQWEHPLACAFRDALARLMPDALALRQFGKFWRFAVP